MTVHLVTSDPARRHRRAGLAAGLACVVAIALGVLAPARAAVAAPPPARAAVPAGRLPVKRAPLPVTRRVLGTTASARNSTKAGTSKSASAPAVARVAKHPTIKITSAGPIPGYPKFAQPSKPAIITRLPKAAQGPASAALNRLLPVDTSALPTPATTGGIQVYGPWGDSWGALTTPPPANAQGPLVYNPATEAWATVPMSPSSIAPGAVTQAACNGFLLPPGYTPLPNQTPPAWLVKICTQIQQTPALSAPPAPKNAQPVTVPGTLGPVMLPPDATPANPETGLPQNASAPTTVQTPFGPATLAPNATPANPQPGLPQNASAPTTVQTPLGPATLAPNATPANPQPGLPQNASAPTTVQTPLGPATLAPNATPANPTTGLPTNASGPTGTDIYGNPVFPGETVCPPVGPC